VRWTLRQLNPSPPPGLRHMAAPMGAAMASARLMVAFQLASAAETVPDALKSAVGADGNRPTLMRAIEAHHQSMCFDQSTAGSAARGGAQQQQHAAPATTTTTSVVVDKNVGHA
jgi:hypothetical protein